MHRSLSFFGVLFCFLLAPFARATSLTGSVVDLTGTAVNKTTFVRFELGNCANNIPRLAGQFAFVATAKDFVPDTLGNLAGQIAGNDAITCDVQGNTFYKVTVWKNGASIYSANYHLTGSGFDIATAIPMSNAPVAFVNVTSYLPGDLLLATSPTQIGVLHGNTAVSPKVLSMHGNGTTSTTWSWVDPATNLPYNQPNGIPQLDSNGKTLLKQLPNALYVDGTTYSTVQSAVNASCGMSPVQTVLIPATYAGSDSPEYINYPCRLQVIDQRNSEDLRPVSTISAPLNPINKFYLRTFHAKIAAMYQGVTPPVQLNLVITGDSVAGNMASFLEQSLQTQFPVAGYGVGSSSGTSGNIIINGNYFTPSGDVLVNDGGAVPYDYTRWPTGVYYDTGVSGALTTGAFTGDTFRVFYIIEPGAGTATVSLNTNGGGFVNIGTISASGTLSGGVFNYSASTVGSNILKITGATGRVKIIGSEETNSTVSGIIYHQISRGGLDMAEATQTPASITGPILAVMAPDLITWDAKESQTEPDGSSFKTDLATFINTLQAGNPLADVILVGSMPVGGPSALQGGSTATGADQILDNRDVRLLAESHNWVYLDNFYPVLDFPTLAGLGLISNGAPPVTLSGGGGQGALAISLVNNFIASVQVSAAGTGYTSAPTVVFTGGTGTGAAGTATISGGGVSGVTVTSPGTGYLVPPTISFTGGGGTGAAAAPNMTGGVSGFKVTYPGSGYTSAPTVTISTSGVLGTGAAGTAVLNATGGVGSITLTAPGTGYIPETTHINNSGRAFMGDIAYSTLLGSFRTGYMPRDVNNLNTISQIFHIRRGPGQGTLGLPDTGTIGTDGSFGLDVALSTTRAFAFSDMTGTIFARLAPLTNQTAGPNMLPEFQVASTGGWIRAYATASVGGVKIGDSSGVPSNVGPILAATFIPGLKNLGTVTTAQTIDANATELVFMTLGANVSLTLSQAGTSGNLLTFFVCQDATGGRTLTWPGNIRGTSPIPVEPNNCLTQSFMNISGTFQSYGMPAITQLGVGAQYTPSPASTVQPQSFTARATNLGSTTLYTPAQPGMYRVCMYGVTSTAGSAGTLAANLSWQDPVAVQSAPLLSGFSLTTLGAFQSGCQEVYADGVHAITYTATMTGATGSPAYSLFVRLTQEK